MAAMSTASGSTGFTLPGMIEEPGCSASSSISASPHNGPDDIQRRSLAILVCTAANERRMDEHSSATSWPAIRGEGAGREIERPAGQFRQRFDHAWREIFRDVDPGAYGRATDRQLPQSQGAGTQSVLAVRKLCRPCTQFLPHGQWHGVHEVGAAGLYHIRQLIGPVAYTVNQ